MIFKLAITDAKANVKKSSEKLAFQEIGGSRQLLFTPATLSLLNATDPALWAALNAPVDSINADAKFLAYLDSDNNGMIRIDEVKAAVAWLLQVVASPSVLEEAIAAVAVDELGSGKIADDLAGFIRHEFETEINAESRLRLATVQGRIAAVSSGSLRGDGIIVPDAVPDPAARVLAEDIVVVTGGTVNTDGKPGVTRGILEKFLGNARAFIHWESTTEQPRFIEGDVVAAYQAFSRLKAKLDEYFSYCALIRLDPGNNARFELHPEKICELDIRDRQAVAEYLANAPLAKPTAEMKLDLNTDINPVYRPAADAFIAAFSVTALDVKLWEKIKLQVAPYEAYTAKARGDKTGSLGAEKLSRYLNSTESDYLRRLLDEDGTLGARIANLKAVEKLLLFRRHLSAFLDNFVNFKNLFSQESASMIQAGSLLMDGRHFDLMLKIVDPGQHKKLAAASNLCMIYAELKRKNGTAEEVIHVVGAITAGNTMRIYVGKPCVFIDSRGLVWNAKVIDFINGPISFWQTVLLPFRKLGETISSRLEKFSSFDTIENTFESSMKNVAQPGKPGLTASSILMLCGGIGVAALGSATAFIIKALSQVHWLRIIGSLAGILFLIFLPLVIAALLKLKRRNLALFIEASGWAVNHPLRLNRRISRVFTYKPSCPAPLARSDEARRSDGYASTPHARINVALVSTIVAIFLVVVTLLTIWLA